MSSKKRTHINTAQNLLTDERQIYVGEWRGANTNLLIKPDGTVNYHREESIQQF